jgi:hypothetical protein
VKFYIAGPMTGIPQFNIPAFDAAAFVLRRKGYECVSPAELDDPEIRAISMASPDGAIATLETHGQTWGDFLARDIKLLADGDITNILVLKGWQKSRGARLQTFVGHALCGMSVFAFDDDATIMPVKHLALYRAWAGDPHLYRTTPGYGVPVMDGVR